MAGNLRQIPYCEVVYTSKRQITNFPFLEIGHNVHPSCYRFKKELKPTITTVKRQGLNKCFPDAFPELMYKSDELNYY